LYTDGISSAIVLFKHYGKQFLLGAHSYTCITWMF